MIYNFCSICAYQTTKPSHYKRHLNSKKHLQKIIEAKESGVTINPAYEFTTSQILDNFDCRMCGETFTTRSSLSRHINHRCQIKKEKVKSSAPEEEKNLDKHLDKHPVDEGNSSSKYFDYCLKLQQDLVNAKDQALGISQNNFQQLLESQDASQTNFQQILESQKEYIQTQTRQLQSQQKQIHTQQKHISNLNKNIKNIQVNQNDYSTTNTLIQTNNKSIQFLNTKMSEMIDMETFINNYKNSYQLDYTQTKRLLESYQLNGAKSYAKCLSKTLKENCHKQLKDMGIDLPQGLLPIITTDSNLRSIKIKTENEWELSCDDSQLNRLVIISNDQVYGFHQLPISIDTKEKTKVINYLKRDNSIGQAKCAIQRFEEDLETDQLETDQLETDPLEADPSNQIKKLETS